MINTTDLSEFEVLLPGDWIRTDSGAVYSFTTDRMELRDERLFREMYILPAGASAGSARSSTGSARSAGSSAGSRTALPYALSIEDDYCAILAGDEKFVITSITRNPDGSMDMEWRDRVNAVIRFHRAV